MMGGAFEICLASPVPVSTSSFDVRQVKEICDRFIGWPAARRHNGFQWSRLRHLISALPISVVTDYCAIGRRAVSSALEEKPDLLVIDFPHAAVLAPPPYSCPSVLFTHNVEAEIFRRHESIARDALRRAIWRNQAAKMERYESRVLANFTTVVAVAERDRDYFQKNYGVSNVSVIPTGVDFAYFSYIGTPPRESADAGTMVFTGSMDWLANIDAIEYFMDEVWPIIAHARPNAKFVVVGKNPPSRLIERAKARGLKWMFTGFVDDVRPYLREAHVYVVPLRVGGGTRIKVYEAMAMGCPVVSTGIGVEGLPVEHGTHYIEADRPAELARAILSLLECAHERSRLSRQARRFVEENMSDRRAAQVFEGICRQVVKH